MIRVQGCFLVPSSQRLREFWIYSSSSLKYNAIAHILHLIRGIIVCNLCSFVLLFVFVWLPYLIASHPPLQESTQADNENECNLAGDYDMVLT